MATIRNLGLIAQLRAEASSHIIRFRGGRVRQSAGASSSGSGRRPPASPKSPWTTGK